MSGPLDVCKLLILFKLGALIEGKIWKDYRVLQIKPKKDTNRFVADSASVAPALSMVV